MKFPLLLSVLSLSSCVMNDVDFSASAGYGPLRIELKRPAKSYGKEPIGKEPIEAAPDPLPPSPTPDLPWWKKAISTAIN